MRSPEAAFGSLHRGSSHYEPRQNKDVYVEKPLSHNVHEGRIAVETSRKYKRVVQYGTGAGSLGDKIAALAKQGTYGELLVSRGLCYKRRGSIGFKQSTAPPISNL